MYHYENSLPFDLFFYIFMLLLTGVRLAGNGSESEGRVEVYYQGKWGTVCDDIWGDEETRVVCRQLGFTSDSYSTHTNAYYGQGSGTIWLDGVECLGSESSLEYCSHLGWGVHNCEHSEDVGVNCTSSEFRSFFL